PKRVLSRERLLELANARDSEAFDRAVDLRIMRIRRKIEVDPTKPAVIRTIRGCGYLFSPSSEKACESHRDNLEFCRLARSSGFTPVDRTNVSRRDCRWILPRQCCTQLHHTSTSLSNNACGQ